MKSLLLAPVGLFLRGYLALAFVLIYIRKHKEKRDSRRIALAAMHDAKNHAQA